MWLFYCYYLQHAQISSGFFIILVKEEAFQNTDRMKADCTASMSTPSPIWHCSLIWWNTKFVGSIDEPQLKCSLGIICIHILQWLSWGEPCSLRCYTRLYFVLECKRIHWDESADNFPAFKNSLLFGGKWDCVLDQFLTWCILFKSKRGVQLGLTTTI